MGAAGNEDCACKGTRHVLRNGVWVDCECLRALREGAILKRAGVPTAHLTLTWALVLEEVRVEVGFRDLWGAAAALAKKTPAKWLVIEGRPARVRERAGSMLLRAAARGGLEGGVVDVRALVDLEFDREAKDRPHRAGAVVLRAGGEPPNRYNKHAVERLLADRDRSDLWTAVVSDGPRSGFGSLYSPRVVDLLARALTVRFSPL